MTKLPYRIGTSYDIHRLIKGEGLILGGIKIPCEYASLAHSDGDVLIHAISEAIIGSLALGDLGKFFPDDDKTTLGMDSTKILQFAVLKARENGYKIGNIDASIIIEKPKLKGYIDSIRQRISDLAGIDISCVSIKAGTNEGVDSLGRKEAMAALASVLLILDEK